MHRFELSPNCSLTVRSASVFYGAVVSTSLIVAGIFAAMGFWPVLPIAGLELAGLGLALRYSMRRGRDRDWVEIDAEAVVVSKQRDGHSTRLRFQRPWTRVRLADGQTPASAPILLIGCRGRWCRVGDFLTADERIGLGRRLGAVLKETD